MKNEEGNEINEENNMTLKIQMADQLYEKYHIEDKYLKLLIKKNNLSIDNEISRFKLNLKKSIINLPIIIKIKKI
jgi:hypothetical protein